MPGPPLHGQQELEVQTRPPKIHGLPAPVPPMTDADYIAVNQALRDLDTLIGNLTAAHEGGAPCDGQLDGCKQLNEKLLQWKSRMFPGRP